MMIWFIVLAGEAGQGIQAIEKNSVITVEKKRI